MISVWALMGCAGGAEADEPEPTVLESLEPAEGTEAQNNNDDDAPDEDEAEEEPEPVPASSDGPAENWPEPEPPEEIYEPTEEGAEALIQYWFDARHYARITGDLEPLEYVSAEDCELCDHGIDILVDVFANDGWYSSEPDEVLDSYVRLETEQDATGIFGLRESAFEVYWEGEFDYEETEDNDSGMGYASSYLDGRWQVMDFSYLGEFHPNTDHLTEEDLEQ